MDLTRGPLHRLASRYALNLLAGTDLGRWKDDDGAPLVAPRNLVRDLVQVPDHSGGNGHPFAAALEELLLRISCHPPRWVGLDRDYLGANLRALGRVLGLDRVELAILQFLAAVQLAPGLKPLTDLLGPMHLGTAVDVVAVACGLPRAEVRRAVTGRLGSTGLFSVEVDPAPLDRKLQVAPRLLHLLSQDGLTAAGLLDYFLPRAPRTRHRSSDFTDAGPAVELARRVLAGALRTRARGVNILLSGPPDSGRKALAGALAREVRATLRTPRYNAGGTFAPFRGDRLGAQLLGQKLLARSRAILLFDEMEEIFWGPPHGLRGGSRGMLPWLERMLEENPVPTIWVATVGNSLDAGLRGRFSVAIDLPPAGAPRREAALRRALRGGRRAAEAAPHLARFAVGEAALQTAARTARLAGGGRLALPELESLLDAGARHASGGRAPAGSALPYRVDLLNASVDLDALAERLARPAAASGVTLCLHGPPGTGKSAYVAHLAERLGRPLLERRVSDIQAKWVGDSEKNLAAAFDEAERGGAVLLFDEADSFLRERRRAHHIWEVTLTNEFLQRLESARGIVACTTNLFADLDPAVLRRFALRVAFDYLRPGQALQLFRAAFAELPGGRELSDEELEARLRQAGPLAPGDFAVVARRARLLAADASAAWLLEELAGEAAARETARPRQAGFRLDGAPDEDQPPSLPSPSRTGDIP